MLFMLQNLKKWKILYTNFNVHENIVYINNNVIYIINNLRKNKIKWFKYEYIT